MHTKSIHAKHSGTFKLGGRLSIHRLGYGAMRLTGKGVWGPPADHGAALATLRRAIDMGINFIDTAESYGPGISEQLIAEALHPYPADLVIATKGGSTAAGPISGRSTADPSGCSKSSRAVFAD